MAANSLSISQVQSIANEYNNFKASLTTGATALSNVISVGTVLYTDVNMADQFPQSWAAYQAYLLSVQSAINTFIENFPVEPALSG